jgi:hypothetical protein
MLVSFYCFLDKLNVSVDSCEYFRFAHRFTRLVSVADDTDKFLFAFPEHHQCLSRVTCEIKFHSSPTIAKTLKPEQVDALMPRPQMIRSEYSVKFLVKKFWHCLSEMISNRAQFGVTVVGPAK